MKVIMGPLWKYELKGFLVKMRDLSESKCVPLLVSYCSDNSGADGMSDMPLDVAVKRPCVRCIVSGENMGAGMMVSARSVGITNTNKAVFWKLQGIIKVT